MLLHTTSKKIEIHNLIISDWEGLFQLKLDIQKAKKDVLLTVPSPENKRLAQSQRNAQCWWWYLGRTISPYFS